MIPPGAGSESACSFLELSSITKLALEPEQEREDQ